MEISAHKLQLAVFGGDPPPTPDAHPLGAVYKSDGWLPQRTPKRLPQGFIISIQQAAAD